MIFLDSSALLKRYVMEPESSFVSELMDDDPRWGVSAIVRTEATIALCRRVSGQDREPQMKRLSADWRFVLAVPIDAECLALAQKIGCDHGVRTLDAVHLAAATRVPDDVRFLTFDRRQTEAALKLGIPVIRSSGMSL